MFPGNFQAKKTQCFSISSVSTLKFYAGKVWACNCWRLHHFMVSFSFFEIEVRHCVVTMQMVVTSICDQIKSMKLQIDLRHSHSLQLTFESACPLFFDNLLVRLVNCLNSLTCIECMYNITAGSKNTFWFVYLLFHLSFAWTRSNVCVCVWSFVWIISTWIANQRKKKKEKRMDKIWFLAIRTFNAHCHVQRNINNAK